MNVWHQTNAAEPKVNISHRREVMRKGNISLAPLHLFQSQSRYVNQERLCKTRSSRKPPMIQSGNKKHHMSPWVFFLLQWPRYAAAVATTAARLSCHAAAKPPGTRLASTLWLWKKKRPHISQAGVTSQASHGEPRVTER